MLTCLSAITHAQTTVLGNSPSSTLDFLGWAPGNPFSLIIKHEAAQPMHFIHDNITTMTIGAVGGVGIFINPNNSAALDVFSNNETGIVATLGGGTVDPSITYNLSEGARFLSDASDSRNTGLVVISSGEDQNTLENFGTYCRPSNAALSIGLVGEVDNPMIGNTSRLSAYFEGNVLITGILPGPSDATLKNTVVDLTDEHSVLLSQVDAKTYKYVQDHYRLQMADDKQYGFLAQEVAQHFPELVRRVNVPVGYYENEEDAPDTCSHLTLDYEKFIALSVKKFQIQDEQIIANAQKVAQLKSELYSMIDEELNLANAVVNDGNDIENKFNMVLYPNPNDGNLNIAIESADLENARIEIFDLNGKKVYNENVGDQPKGGVINIDISLLRRGLYDLRLTDSSNSSSSKFLKK